MRMSTASPKGREKKEEKMGTDTKLVVGTNPLTILP